MNIITKVIRNSKELEDFEKNTIGSRFYASPDKYPCIAVVGNGSPNIDWSERGFKIHKTQEIMFLYPDDIQKELYDNDFNNLLKD